MTVPRLPCCRSKCTVRPKKILLETPLPTTWVHFVIWKHSLFTTERWLRIQQQAKRLRVMPERVPAARHPNQKHQLRTKASAVRPPNQKTQLKTKAAALNSKSILLFVLCGGKNNANIIPPIVPHGTSIWCSNIDDVDAVYDRPRDIGCLLHFFKRNEIQHYPTIETIQSDHFLLI